MKTRTRLSLITGGLFLAASMISMIVFNIIMSAQIRSNSADAICTVANGDYEDTLYTTNILDLTTQYETYDGYDPSEQETAIAGWCKTNAKTDTLYKVKLDHHLYYLMAQSYEYEAIITVAVIYVDVTSEASLMVTVNMAIGIVMLLLSACVSFLGYMTGIRIEKINQSQKHFFENSSHELKTPLTSIQGFAEGMVTGVITDHRRAAQIILKESEKMSSLVEDILTSARFEDGAVRLQLEPASIRSMVEDCLMPLEPIIFKKKLDVKIDIEDEEILADVDYFSHAIDNIISNAVKFAKSILIIRYKRGVLSVSNDGDIPSDQEMSHLFERFYTGERGHTGIGLALSKEIIERHGYSVAARHSNERMCVEVNVSKAKAR